MLRCTTPTNIFKITLTKPVIKSLTVLYAQNKCVLLEKEVPLDNIYPSKSNPAQICYARVDLMQQDTGAFVNVDAGKVEIQLCVQTRDNAVLYSHAIETEIGGVLKDCYFDDSIAGTGQLDFDYDAVNALETDFVPMTAIFDGDFDDVQYISHDYIGSQGEDINVSVDTENWEITAELSEKRKAELETLHETSVARLDFTVDPKTYAMTIRLYNDKGEIIDTDTQDIPLEMALVGIRWDAESQSVVFKTDAGTETAVPLTGLAATSALEEIEKTLTKAITDEQTARGESEQQLREDLSEAIGEETKQREQAVETLQKAVETANEAIEQESTDRDAAISQAVSEVEETIQQAIAAEASEREQAIQQEATDREQAISQETADRKKAVAAEQSRAEKVESDLEGKITEEAQRATAAEQANAKAITAEAQRATAEEGTIAASVETAKEDLQAAVTAEEKRATAAEEKNAAAVETEKSRAQGVESTLSGEIAEIQGLIPSQATPENQLADKDFVNSTVSTQTAHFQGSFATKAALDAWQYENTTTATNNDYAVVQADETHNNECWRYKYTQPDPTFKGKWTAEYKVNNAPLSIAQVKALNSGITEEKIAAMDKAVEDETARAQGAEEENAAAITAEEKRATAAEQANETAISAEVTRAKAEEKSLSGKIAAETTARDTAIEEAIQQEVTDRDAAIKVETDRAKAEEAKKVNSSDGELKDTVVTFTDTEVTTDANVASGEKTSTLWAKVKRWFGRLKALAFKQTVSTSDIDNKAVTKAKVGDDVSTVLDNSVLKTKQTLTATEQAQVRANIGAGQDLTIVAEAGENISAVGTPEVEATTAGTKITFTFNYLKGEQGKTGPQGAEGPQGEQGKIGPTGPAGPAGPQGPAGSTGANGTNGKDGVTPQIKATAGSDIGAVGTPSVTAETVGDTTTFTFHKLKGEKGDAGSGGDLSNYVDKTTAQTITGNKTFQSKAPVSGTPNGSSALKAQDTSGGTSAEYGGSGVTVHRSSSNYFVNLPLRAGRLALQSDIPDPKAANGFVIRYEPKGGFKDIRPDEYHVNGHRWGNVLTFSSGIDSTTVTIRLINSGSAQEGGYAYTYNRVTTADFYLASGEDFVQKLCEICKDVFDDFVQNPDYPDASAGDLDSIVIKDTLYVSSVYDEQIDIYAFDIDYGTIRNIGYFQAPKEFAQIDFYFKYLPQEDRPYSFWATVKGATLK